MRSWSLIVPALIVCAGCCAGADNLVQEVRHELLLVPHYTVFDWLAYRVDGSNVTLLGYAVDADLKRNAEDAVKKIGGVGGVENDVEVLPASASDDRIRRAIHDSINKQMSVYLVEAVRSIHIVVKNGNVMLEGQVAEQSDKDHVLALAKHVQNVRDVTNNLVVQK